MKKNLSLILALVMILGSFSSVFAAVAPVETPVDAGAFLKDKGVLVGNAEGDLMLDELLARQDAVILVAQLRGMVEAALAYPGDAGYEDVKDPFYNGPLKWAQDEGLFVGRTEKVFGFDDNLTVQEYAKVLLTALGYSVGPNGGVDIAWDKALDKAEEFGMLTNLKDLVETDGIKRGDMALMTFNALSVMMKDGKMTLAENLKIEMPEAKELTAEVKDTTNLKEVVVELSNAKLADQDKLMDKDNYRVDNMKIERVTLDGDNVILLLQEGKIMVKDKSYDLTIRAIDTKINGKYNFKAKDNTSPKVEKVQVLGEYGIKVTFTEPVEKADERDFLIDGKNVAMVVEPYGRDLILTPYHDKAFASDAKTLTVEEVTDFAGYKSALEEIAIEIVKDNEAPKVKDVVIKGNVVEVTFDKDVYKKSVKGYENRVNEGNISYREGRVTVFTENKAAKKVDTNKVEYTFKNDIPRNADLTIEGVQNHSKVAMEKVTMQGREIKDNLEPEVIDVDISTTAGTLGLNDSKAKITVEFDKNVKGYFLAGSDEKAFVPEKHFTLYEREVANRNIVDGSKGKVVSVKYDGSKRDTIVVELENLRINEKREYDYILEIVDFEDSNRNRMYRYFYDFSISEDDEDLIVKNITINTDTRREEIEFKIDFNEPVDEVLARDVYNHYLFMDGNSADSVKDLDGKIEVANNGRTVFITLPDFKDLNAFKADYNAFKILRTLKDKDGNRLGAEVEFNFTAYASYEAQLAAEAVVTPSTKVTFVYDSKVKTELELAKAATSAAITVKHDSGNSASAAATGRYVIEDSRGIATTTGTLSGSEVVAGVTTFTVNVPLDVAGKYTLRVVIGDEISTLPITILETDVTGTVKMKDANLVKTLDAGAVTTPVAFELDYGVKGADLTAADLVVTKNEKAAVNVVKTGSTEFVVTITAESGAEATYTVKLVEAKKVSSVSFTPAANNQTLTVTVEDAATGPISNIGKEYFSVKVNNSVVQVLAAVESTPGVYTVTLASSLPAAPATVEVKVDTVVETVTY